MYTYVYICALNICAYIYIFIGIHGSDFPSVDSHHLCVVRRNMGTATTNTSSRGCFSPSRCAATHCNTHCNTLQHTVNSIMSPRGFFFALHVCVFCACVCACSHVSALSTMCAAKSTLSVTHLEFQRVAVCCSSVLQCVAVRASSCVFFLSTMCVAKSTVAVIHLELQCVAAVCCKVLQGVLAFA